MRKDKQRGAIVVEATIALTAFIFTIFTILSIVNICFVQAKINIALNAAAKDISQYSYLYYALGVDNLESKFNQGTADSKQLAEDTIDGVGTFLSSLSGAASSAQEGDFDRMVDEINNGATSAESLITKYADKLKNDPKGFILGMGKMATNELKEEGKVLLAQILAKTFMEKNLMSRANDDADAFLKRYKVVDGMDGLNFNYTTFLAYGESDEIQLVVTYKIKVIQLLNIDYEFTIRQCCKTLAWDNGVSLLNKTDTTISQGENVWDLDNTAERGEKIVAAEKGKYTYTSSGVGYDAYNNSGNANEFVTITTADTTMKTYTTEKGIRSKLLSERRKLENGAATQGEDIKVTNSSGETVTLKSDPDTRTYKIVLVVPDDAVNAQYVKDAVANFQKDYPGYTVVVKGGYGNPTPEPAEPSAE